MLYIIRPRHVSKRGPVYTRTHVVVRKSGQSLSEATRCTGAIAAAGAPYRRVFRCVIPEIVYAIPPIVLDPDHIVVKLVGMPGGVYVTIPYKCTYGELVDAVIPAKLRAMGVHPHDVVGAPYVSGRPATAWDIWRESPPCVHWTKLGVPVSFLEPVGVRTLQLAYRRRQKETWVLLQDGLEPTTNSS